MKRLSSVYVVMVVSDHDDEMRIHGDGFYRTEAAAESAAANLARSEPYLSSLRWVYRAAKCQEYIASHNPNSPLPSEHMRIRDEASAYAAKEGAALDVHALSDKQVLELCQDIIVVELTRKD